ncbi:MAG: amidophosphoribosyltransferase [Candidatus Levybacteria bacterium]|nr:amidophosphoribosyltransferase [Candidatus Levybacteria bacterium]
MLKKKLKRNNKLHDKCGVFGVFAPDLGVARLTYYALYGLQHRGQESSGIAVSNGRRFKLKRGMGLVRDVFKTEKNIDALGEGILAVGHNRYSTTGSSHIHNAQPFLLKKDERQIVIAHNGNLINSQELRKKVKEITLSSTTDTEIVAALLLESKKTTWSERFAEVLPQLKGAYSFVIATRDLLFGIRDPLGIRPLILGKINNGWVLSSEDCVFPGIGATFVREVKPGEAVIIDKNGPQTFYQQEVKQEAFCIFEYVYIARPDSTLHGESVGKVRERCGEILVQEAPVEADMVMPIPYSGITAAIAFARKSGIPFGEGVIQNRYIGRTFIQPDQRMRELGINANLKGKRVVVVDDSIVRGNTLKDFVSLLRNYGATKVHIRIASPPITDPCYYGLDTPKKDKLIASRFEKKKPLGINQKAVDVEKIRTFIGADSFVYISLKGLLKAAGVKDTDKKNFDPQKTKFCMACMNGIYKIPLGGKENKFMLENPLYPSELIEKE